MKLSPNQSDPSGHDEPTHFPLPTHQVTITGENQLVATAVLPCLPGAPEPERDPTPR